MGSKAREGAKAMSLAFVLLDFQHCVCYYTLTDTDTCDVLKYLLLDLLGHCVWCYTLTDTDTCAEIIVGGSLRAFCLVLHSL